MSSFLQHFESLGDNCEFGFVLINNGIHDGGMFRWTMIRDFRQVVRAIDDGFDNIYAFENLAPCSPDMVRDSKSGIEFHTKMPIIAKENGFEFGAPKNDLRPTHYYEREKCFYLSEKFFKTLQQASKIYVLKSTDAPVSRDVVDEVLAGLRRRGDVSLLWVCESDTDHPAGTVEKLSDHLYSGFITRFSTRLTIEDIDVNGWLSVCETTFNLHVSTHGAFQNTNEHQPSPTQRPLELPSWFNPQLYLLANPDVADAGMDAGDHYLQFGWKEGRLTQP